MRRRRGWRAAGTYLAGEGLGELLAVGAERVGSVVAQQVLQPLVGAVLAQHHVAPVGELGQQEVAAASLAPKGAFGDQTCGFTPGRGLTRNWPRAGRRAPPLPTGAEPAPNPAPAPSPAKPRPHL